MDSRFIISFNPLAGDTNRLSLNNVSGVISLTPQRVDYETGSPTYSLTVRARDNPSSTGPKLTVRISISECIPKIRIVTVSILLNVSTIQAANDATFTLTVTDCNDFPPVFTQSDHSFTISERSTMTTANEIVYSGINVTDQDATAANRIVSYQIVGGLRTTNNWFNIDSTTVRTFYIYKC